ncbi:MAG: histidinol-phosphate aminotransferase family protein [Ignavibacteria bacterium]|nr:histidinol-phosphate aminotransferase family protein [Ignavibacteria bacterium]
MSNALSRRKWLQSSLSAIGGVALATALPSTIQAKSFEAACHASPRELALKDEGWLLLGSNENAYGPSPKAREAMLEAVQRGNRYANVQPLVQDIAAFRGVAPENIVVGAGSAEILGLAALAFAKPGMDVIAVTPTFFVLQSMARRSGANVVEISLDADLRHDLSKMASAISPKTSVVYVCNPNNPTGTKLEASQLRAFCEEAAKRAVVVVDEVYHDFLTDIQKDPSMIPLAAQNPNVIVVRSFSKLYGLAGMRVGYGIGHPETVKKLVALQAWSANAISQVSMAAAQASLKDQAFITMANGKIAEGREIVSSYLKSEGIFHPQSFANVIYFETEKYPKDFAKLMESKQVIVRDGTALNRRFCRVSMGTTEEMHKFVEVLKSLKV